MIRILLRALIKGAMGFVTIIVMSMTLAPATATETALFGTSPERFELVQVRLARAMMDVAPDMTVAAYAKATGVPADAIRHFLNEKASGSALLAKASR